MSSAAGATSQSATTSGSRSRPQARKKHADDAPYFAPGAHSSSASGAVSAGAGSVMAGAGTKRHAADRADGEPRVKRKRVDGGAGTGGHTASAAAMTGKRDGDTHSDKATLVDFGTLSSTVLYRYLTQFDLVPPIRPPPWTADDPPPPSALEHTYRDRHSSRGPSPLPQITPANRPRRDVPLNSHPGYGLQPSANGEMRRRSLRLAEDDGPPPRAAILADVHELHVVLATVVDRHFREQLSISGREEVDTLASFMCAVEKAKGGRLRY